MNTLAADPSHADTCSAGQWRVVDGRGNSFVIDPSAFAANLAHLREILPESAKVMQVAKGNGYGIGLANVLALGQRFGLNEFCVGTPEEAYAAKRIAPDARILLFTSCPPDKLPQLIAKGITVSVNNLQALEVLVEAHVSGEIFLELECGFGRFGLNMADLQTAIAMIGEQERLRLAGVYTHFGQQEGNALDQGLARFDEMVATIGERIHHEFMTMAAGSHTIVQRPYLTYNAVDPGRLLYGLVNLPNKFQGTPVVREVSSTLIQINQPEDSGKLSIGYGDTISLEAGSRTGVFPLGWYDGLSASAPFGHVLIQGRKTPVIARTLLHSIIDLSGIEDALDVGEPVVLIDDHAESELGWCEAADAMGMDETRLHFALLGGVNRHSI